MKRKNCMKRKYMFMALLCYALTTAAQDASHNYVRTRSMLDEMGGKYLDKVEYFDGLGRPFQTVLKKVTASNSNLVTLQEYDVAGRAVNSWLPIVSSAEYVAPAAFKSSAPSNYGNDSRPYGQPVYEASPLNRTVKEYGPGAAWHGGHSVNTDYLANSTANAQLNCINYGVSSAGALTSNGSYASGQLSVVKTTDEDLNVSYTFTDKMGHVVLSRQMKGSETHDTYYVYDDKSNLCFVLQPMYQSLANLDLYAFQYKYDGRNRCIWKKLPGAGYMEMVYDNADRLVFSQDGNQRALTSGNWTYYKYDGLNRLTEQGTCTNKVTTSGTNVLVQHFYDSYAFRSQAGFNNSNFPDDASGNGKGALTASVATVLGSSNKIYTAYYYDIKGRVVKTVQSNPLGGYDVAATVYTFTNKPATVTHTHTASGKTTRTEVYTYSYDHADRLLKVEHTLGGTKITLADYAYDNLGRLQSKSLHGSATNKLTYAYNVRGWLTGISGSKFTQNLYYNTGTGTAKYNGSISSMTWKAGNESTIRGYKFTYDGLSRLMNATYGETAGINTNTNRFSENVTAYDKNGNIKTLWKIQCKLPPKTKRFCPLKTFNNAPLKSLDRWGYYYFSLFPSVCSHFTDTFSCQLNPVRRMYNTIHNGICYCRVSDCIIPIVRWQLRGDDDGLAPMSVLYYIEQDGSFLGIKVHKEEVIQYEQRAPFDSLEFRFQCAFYFCHLKRTHKFRSIRIICPYALLAGFIPHCCGKEALPGTG